MNNLFICYSWACKCAGGEGSHGYMAGMVKDGTGRFVGLVLG